jgi:hypothetical protein
LLLNAKRAIWRTWYYTLSQYDSSPPLTACKILVIVIDSSFVEQVEEPGIYRSKYWFFWHFGSNINQKHRISDVMVSALASSVVDRGFEPRSGQTKDYSIGMCSITEKEQSCLARNQKSLKIPKGQWETYIEEEQTTQWWKEKVQKDKRVRTHDLPHSRPAR